MQLKSLQWLAVHAPATPTRGKAKPASRPGRPKEKLGALPEWNLKDLYSAPDAAALKADLEASERAAEAMQANYAGKLSVLADGGKGGKALAKAVREYEGLSDLMDRAAIGLGGVFLHLNAELNFHRLFDDTIAGVDLGDVARRQKEAFTAAGVPLPEGSVQ